MDGQLNAQQGHCWEGSLNKLNAAASCRTCGLYLEQTYSPDKFKMLMELPCKHRPAVIPPQLDGVSRTHRWYCLGSELACFDCHCVLKVGKRVPTQVALQVCKGRPTQNSSRRITDQLPKSWPFPQASPFPAASSSTDCGPRVSARSPSQQLSSNPAGSSLDGSNRKGRVGGSKRQGSPPTTVGASEPNGKRSKVRPAADGATTLVQVLRRGANLPPQNRPGTCTVDNRNAVVVQEQPGDPRMPLRQTGIAKWFNQQTPAQATVTGTATAGASVQEATAGTSQGDTSTARPGHSRRQREGDPKGLKPSKLAVKSGAQQKLTFFADRSLVQANNKH